MTRAENWKYLTNKAGKSILVRKEPGRGGRYIFRESFYLDSDTLDGLAEQISVHEWLEPPLIEAEEEHDYDSTYSRLVAYGSRYATEEETKEIVSAAKAEAEKKKADKAEKEARDRAELARLKALYPE